MRAPVLILLLLAALGSAAAAPKEIVRESRTVVVDGVRETWRLVWRGEPKPICDADEVIGAITCPCSGVAYGEMGDLRLERLRPNRKPEELKLGPLAEPVLAEVPKNTASLRRWPMKDSDLDRSQRGDPSLLAEVHRRPDLRAMQPGDYDHDGRATEFLFQVGTLPCGRHQYVAVGISKADPRLHALGSAAHPNRPLVMPIGPWQALLKASHPSPILIWPCGDHGSEVDSYVEVSAVGGRIHAVDRDYACDAGKGRGTLVKTTVW